MSSNRNKHIVVINDNPMHARLITSTLTRAGYLSQSFSSAAEALEYMTANGAPSLIITDIHMPGIDGWKLCRLVKSGVFSWLNRVPLIVISSTFTGTPTEEVTVQTGADAFLSIPFKPDDLIDCVHTLSEGGVIQQQRRAMICSKSGEGTDEAAGFLKKRGFEVTMVTEMDEALSVLHDTPPDLVVIDVAACGASSDALISTIRTAATLTVIIVTLGSPDSDIVTRLFSLGVDGYVLKPFDPGVLLVQFETIHRERSLLRIEDLLEKRSESLRESEDRYRSLISSIQTGFALFEVDTDDNGQPCNFRFLEANETYRRMLHLAPGPLVGRRVTEVYKPGFMPLDEWIPRFGEISINGGELEFEHYIRDIDLWVKIFAYSPRRGRFAVQLIDIHDRKMAQKALQEKEALLRNVFESIPDLLVVINSDKQVVYSNWHGYEHIPEDVRRSKPICFEITQNRGFACSECHVSKVFSTGLPVSREFRNDITNRIYVINAYPVTGPDGGVHLVVEHVRDVTEQRRAAEEQQRMNKLESIGVLAGGIAHDYNNILATILGNASLARMLTGNEKELIEVLGEIENAGNRAKALNQKFITFSKGGDPVRKVGDISELVRDSVTLSLTGSHIENAMVLDQNALNVEFDSGQMQHAFHNILLNARQAMPDGGTVTIVAAYCTISGDEDLPLQNGRYVKISFSDTGTGISEDDLKYVFDPYFTRKPDSSGLGLTTTYSVIQKHNGCMTIDSVVNCGTTVTIYLPAALPAAESHEAPSATREDRHMKILVMDDEPAVMKVVKKMIQSLGHEVDGARDGGEAIEAYRNALDAGIPYDAVIMDLTIPGGMGGKEAIMRLCELDPDVTAIVSSGYSSDPILSDHESYGFKGIITKPFHLSELKAVLAGLQVKE